MTPHSAPAPRISPPGFDLQAFLNEVTDLYAGEWCLRATGRRHTWKRTSEGGFNPRHYRVQEIAHADAEGFVLRHHYAGSYSQARLRIGLIDARDDRLVGVATLGNGMNKKIITNPLPTLTKDNAAELSRLVLIDEVPAPAESWFVRRAMRHAQDHGLKAAVMFSDPVPRPDVGMPGHVGIVYQALNADYCDRATAGPLTVLPTGAVLTRRSLQKVRGWESGAGGVVRRFVAAGADEPQPGECGKAYLRRAIQAVRPQRVPHDGNHRFVLRFGTARQRRRIPLGDGFEPRPYPKKPDPIPIYQ
jgi:hypothetical protein